ncbi:MAG: type I-U CRISPR-associated protein Csb2 [Bifidobacterium dentium]
MVFIRAAIPAVNQNRTLRSIRLYSALVSAAYLTFGFEKVDAEYGLTDEQIHDALNWFEDNPPQEILFPRVIRAGSRATVYRNKGNVQNKKKPKDKVSPAEAYIATAYEQYPESGMLLTWAWHENPSPEVFKTLNLLCDEVPYLGEACSVVELHAHEDYVFPAAAEDCVWTLSSDSALGSIFRKGRPLSFPRRGPSR